MTNTPHLPHVPNPETKPPYLTTPRYAPPDEPKPPGVWISEIGWSYDMIGEQCSVEIPQEPTPLRRDFTILEQCPWTHWICLQSGITGHQYKVFYPPHQVWIHI